MGQSHSSSSSASSSRYSSSVDDESPSTSYSSAQQGLPSTEGYSYEDENIHPGPCIVMTESTPPSDLELAEFALRRALIENPDDAAGENTDSKLIRGERDRLLLVRLLNQVESLRAEREAKVLLPEAKHVETPLCSEPKIEEDGDDLPIDGKNFNDESIGSDKIDKKVRAEELMREIGEVKQQNRLTHWILGIMFVTTVIWRLSEVAVALRIKSKVRNPLKAIGGIFINFFNKESMTGSESSKVHHPPHIQAPQFPHIEIPSIFQSNGISESNSTSRPHSGPVQQMEENKSVLDHIMQIPNSHISSHGNFRVPSHRNAVQFSHGVNHPQHFN